MRVSVIIPCFNAAETIALQLDAIARQSVAPWEVIVADNGSTDNSRAIALQYQDQLPNLKIVDASGRRGAAHARNRGAAVATGEVLAFCDADDVVSAEWVAGVTEAVTLHPFIASRFEHRLLNNGYQVCEAPEGSQVDRLQQFDPPFLPHAGGCGLAIVRSLHEAIGGFDEDMPFLEDTDYCLKVQLHGIPLHFASNACVHIRAHSSLRRAYRQAFLWGRSSVLLYKKYRPYGMQRHPWRVSLRHWLGFLWWSARSLVSRSRDGVWIRAVGWRMGQLAGCIRYRVLAL
ncbi:MAG TPA: glycosyltransferase [Synechococcales cyanobacterium M55_K2018_004]|nr:glycosyltransferase [Synechococcales cyanobacterium M55_K2018_004]